MAAKVENSHLGVVAARSIALVNKLKEAGVDRDLQLPRIVFAGKQSAGKSSLVEAVTGIELPRAHGTCTKCPIEVTTQRTSDSSWRCKIHLRLSYDANGQSAASTKVKEVCMLTAAERRTMPERIKKAQEMILTESGGAKQKFTKNCICIEMQGSDCHDLSIVDLPGLIQSTDKKEDEIYINLVESLVKEYIAGDNTVILQCIQSDEDMENQKIRTLAREADPEGKRSLGVLTKPDKLDPGTEDDILAMLRGDKYALYWGYYVVRTPRQEEMMELDKKGDSEEYQLERRKIEDNFFSSDCLGMRLSECRADCCGSENLLQMLAQMLQKLIDSQLPEMKKTLEELALRSSQDLENLGSFVGEEDARKELDNIIATFGHAVEEHIHTSAKTKEFWKKVETKTMGMAKSLQHFAPVFDVCGKAIFEGLLDSSDGPVDWSIAKHVTIVLTREDLEAKRACLSNEQTVDNTTWKVLVRFSAFGVPVVSLVAITLPGFVSSIEVEYRVVPSSMKLEAVEKTFRQKFSTGKASASSHEITEMMEDDLRIDIYVRQIAFHANSKSEQVYSVLEVRRMIDDARGRDVPLPGPAGYHASMSIASMTNEKWEGPALEHCENVHEAIVDWFLEAPNCVLDMAVPSQYQRVRHFIRDSLLGLLNELKAKTRERVEEIWLMEKNPFTCDFDYLSFLRHKYLVIVDDALAKESMEAKLESLGEQNFKMLESFLQRLGLKSEQLSLISSGKHLNDEAKETIAGALAYIRIALKRFQDGVAKHVFHHLLDAFARDCSDQLKHDFGFYDRTSRDLHIFFQQDPLIEKERLALEARIQRQDLALKLLNKHARGEWVS